MKAAENGQTESMTLLIKNGAEVNAKTTVRRSLFLFGTRSLSPSLCCVSLRVCISVLSLHLFTLT